jgi:aryl-alcohol dehydrogenase-like predicted oxidoreductase
MAAARPRSIFGDWHTSRNVPREEIVLIGKGAHSPLCYPDVIAKQLDQSLEPAEDRLRRHLFHAPRQSRHSGRRVRRRDGCARSSAGGSAASSAARTGRESGWTRQAYAAKNGKAAPAALSNNFSLAEMLDPIWAGMRDVLRRRMEDVAERRRQVPNFAWSSQGRGFFTDRAGRDKLDDEEIVRCWYSERNFERRDRAIELAAKLGRSPIHIALAYVIAQPSDGLFG